jgi:diguanylate cyclase (GGDEF)-like protein
VRIGTHVTVRFNLYDEEEAALQRRLFENVIQDTLTGAYNRRFFERSLGNEATQANRLGTPLAVLALQIDEIRRIAEYYTQAGADALLSRVVKLAHEAVRPEDIVGRIASDQFGVIVRGMARADVTKIAEDIRSKVEVLEILWQSGDFSMNIEQITSSVVVAMLDDVAATPTADALMAEITKRLGAARAQGGNIVIGDP